MKKQGVDCVYPKLLCVGGKGVGLWKIVNAWIVSDESSRILFFNRNFLWGTLGGDLLFIVCFYHFYFQLMLTYIIILVPGILPND